MADTTERDEDSGRRRVESLTVERVRGRYRLWECPCPNCENLYLRVPFGPCPECGQNLESWDGVFVDRLRHDKGRVREADLRLAVTVLRARYKSMIAGREHIPDDAPANTSEGDRHQRENYWLVTHADRYRHAADRLDDVLKDSKEDQSIPHHPDGCQCLRCLFETGRSRDEDDVFRERIDEALRSYRCQHAFYEADDSPMRLVDALGRDDGSIREGDREIEMLADHLADELTGIAS